MLPKKQQQSVLYSFRRFVRFPEGGSVLKHFSGATKWKKRSLIFEAKNKKKQSIARISSIVLTEFSRVTALHAPLAGTSMQPREKMERKILY